VGLDFNAETVARYIEAVSHPNASFKNRVLPSLHSRIQATTQVDAVIKIVTRPGGGSTHEAQRAVGRINLASGRIPSGEFDGAGSGKEGAGDAVRTKSGVSGSECRACLGKAGPGDGHV